jgi:hypothetical protein
LNAIAESVGCVAASSENLRLAVERRTSGQKPIFVAPDPGSWGTFRTSAYSPELKWEILGGRSFGETIWNFLLKSTRAPYYYGLKQLPTVSRGPSEDPAEFARRTQLRMDEAREHLAQQLNDGRSGRGYWRDYRGSWLLTITSSLTFFVPALFGYGSVVQRVAMTIQGIIGIAFHSTGNEPAMRADVALRNVMAPTFSLWEIYANANWIPAILGLFSAAHYVSGVFTEREHALFLQLPVSIGRLSIRSMPRIAEV